MSAKRKEQIVALLKGIETGDPKSVEVVNQDKYIQHNPLTLEGGEGLAALFKRLSNTNPRVNIVRIFSDGDYVFGHTEYDFSASRVGFEIFRFEGEQAVEHWDNIQTRKGPNASGHSMVDGQTEVTDQNLTEINRALVERFVSSVLIPRQFGQLTDFISETYTEHNPVLRDGVASLHAALSKKSPDTLIQYNKVHHILAEGNFVLTACEGARGTEETSFYDLFRISDGRIVEHWDTSEAIPPRSEWKNENGKF
ncbi:nuclear transport factor 2 family protein [Marinomonas balearica]|uniref:Putative SnoaL-like aldol condensation-catalyzing enzyme n=1 Tax=Marinomonas balearica TaxID=491947 RepID=A0A4R6ME75_9GAMM|nr:nuclear transport factor 2 family protein [Marinomonas balearica]TDO98990.1 putative SnoaL-like aldol condensation-catalyzing enzyme [Marinomonas balearica]